MLQTRGLSFQQFWVTGACIGAGVIALIFSGSLWASSARMSADAPPSATNIRAAQSSRPQASPAQLLLNFVVNAGQADPVVRFYVKGAGHTVFFTPAEVVFSAGRQAEGERTDWSVVRLRFDGTNVNPRLEGVQPLAGTASFFLGNDPANWRTQVPTYGGVAYRELYPGIDLIYHGTEGQLKSEFVVAPGVDAGQIRLVYRGVQAVRRRGDGALVLQTGLGELVEERPLIYQEVEGRRVEVEGGYRMLGGGEVGFALGAYDATRPLVIDPTLSYSTYLGGSSFDRGLALAVDGSGNAYVTGTTLSSDFPTTAGAYSTSLNGSFDIFVTKVNVGGTGLSYSTYLGGSGSDIGNGVAADGSGNAYVTGQTRSTDFPTVSAIQGTHGDGGTNNDAFVVKLNAGGAGLGYSTYLGGTSSDVGAGIAVDSLGGAYVTGSTSSVNFPTVGPIQAAGGGGTDAFVTKVNAAGTSWSYSTYLGGGGTDVGRGIAVDGSGSAYVAGQTGSSDFPTATPIQGSIAGAKDAFVTQVNVGGTAWGYSTYLGGSSSDNGMAITVDGSGDAYVTGSTLSTDFPTTTGVFDTSANGSDDVFVTKVAAGGTAWSYSTYLGGSSTDIGRGIGVGSGTAYVTGETGSTDFPTASPFQATNGGGTRDAFMTEVAADASVLSFSTYLGGAQGDFGTGLAMNSAGGSVSAYVVGETDSSDFPTANALQPASGGSRDAFVAKFCALFGDLDSDSDVDVQDVQLVAAAWRSDPPDPLYDLDADNDVDVADVISAAAHLGDPCP